jgi:cell division septation protein DedD
MSHRFVATIAIAGLALMGLATAGGAQDPPSPARAKGMVFDGLVAKERGMCAGHYRLVSPREIPICTHGPDPAPQGVDVTEHRTIADLTEPTTAGDALGAGGIWCSGTGTDGSRVQAVYAVASDRADRFADVAPLIAGWAAQMDSALNQSSAETGGDLHIRFVTTPDCALDVDKVVLSPTGDDTISNTITELRNQGFNQSGRKYLIWSDASVYCGIAQVTSSDVAGATNPANGGPHYARVDTGCWGRSDHLSELHELMHTLGAVQQSAPHSTPGFHCSDEYDAMCYRDSSTVTMTYPCPTSHEWLLDCNHDDYFHTSPPSGSYLATHWNVATSVYLASGGTVVPPEPEPEPTPSPAPSPTSSPTPTASPAPTSTSTTPAPTPTSSSPAPTSTSTSTAPPAPTSVTTTFSGSLSKRRPSKTFTLGVGDGDTTSTLTFQGKGKLKVASSLRLRILMADGTVLADATGPSVLRLAAHLPAGAHTWEVSGTSDVTFTLEVRAIAP